MNKKQKLISTAITTATALSSVVSTSAMIMQSVNALENGENTEENTPLTQPVKKTELQNKVDEKNTELVSASTVLNAVETEKDKAQAIAKQAADARDANTNKEISAKENANTTLANEVKDLAQKVLDYQSQIDEMTKNKDSLNQQIADKQKAIEEEQAKVDQAQKELDQQKDAHQDTLQKYDEAKKDKEEAQKELDSLNTQLADSKSSLQTAQKDLADAKADLKLHEDKLNSLSQEKTTLETSLKEHQDRLVKLQDALNKESTPEELQQMQNTMTELKGEIDTLTQQVQEKETSIGQINSQINTLNLQITNANTKLDDTQREYDEASKQLEVAQTALDNATANYNQLKTDVDNIEKGVDTSELAQLKQDLSNLQNQLSNENDKLAAAQDNFDKATTAFLNAGEKYNDNVVNFYRYIYEKTGSLDAYYAYTELEKYQGEVYTKDGYSATIYDKNNYEKTCASLTDIKHAINYIKMSNDIRNYEHKNPFKVSYWLMAVSAIQNEIASVKFNHAQEYPVWENLYWSPLPISSEKFLDDNGHLDVEHLNDVGRGNVEGSTHDLFNPFYGWWIEEKINYETHNGEQTGHYETLINDTLTLTGFSYNNQNTNRNQYDYYTWGQVFTPSLRLKKLDGSGSEAVEGITPEEFEKQINDWIVYKAQAVVQTQTDYDNANTALEQAKANVQSAATQLNNKEAEIRNYKKNLNQQFANAKSQVETATQTVNDTIAKRDNASKQLSDAQAKLAELKQSLEEAKANLNATKDEKATLQKTIDTRETEYSKVSDTYNIASANREELNTQIASENNAIKEANDKLAINAKEITNETSGQVQANKAIATNESKILELNNIINTTAAQQTTTKNKVDALLSEIAGYEKTLAQYKATQEALKNAQDTLEKDQATLASLKNQVKELEMKISEAINVKANTSDKEKVAQQALSQWEAIKNDESIISTEGNYGPYEDETLKGLISTIQTYLDARAKAPELKTKFEEVNAIADKANAKYIEAKAAHDQVEAEYNAAKKELDTFVENIGTVSEDTITVDKYVLYTGKQLTPNVVVKDSKGNVVSPDEYTLVYDDNTELGEGRIAIVMNGENYVGAFTKTFKIVKELPKAPEQTQNTKNTPQQSQTKQNAKQGGKTVQTGDDAPVAGFGLMAMLSSAFYFVTKRSKKEN